MKSISYKKISVFLIFGGGEIITDICLFLKKRRKKIIVIASKQQANDFIQSKKMKLKNFLNKNKIKLIIINKNDNKWINLVKKHTFGISHSHRWIFEKDQIKKFDNKLINFHYSNLPAFRGAGGLTWNILTKRYISGSTIHLVNKKIDMGFSLMTRSFSFPKKIRSSLSEMQNYSLLIQKKFIIKFLTRLLKGSSFQLKAISNDKDSFYWPRLNTKKNAWINWNWHARDIVDFINAFSKPYEGAATQIEKNVVRFTEANFLNTKIKFHPFQYGLIFRKTAKKIYVAANQGIVVINIMNNDYKGKYLGKRLFSSLKNLEQSFKLVRI